MKTVVDKEKFVELRAGGMSFAKIAKEIKASKPTLIKWNLEFKKEIENRRFLAAEELLENYKLMQVSRIKLFGEVLSKALEELRMREFNSTPLKELIALISHLEDRILQESKSIQYVTDHQPSFWEEMEDKMGPIKIGLFDQK